MYTSLTQLSTDMQASRDLKVLQHQHAQLRLRVHHDKIKQSTLTK